MFIFTASTLSFVSSNLNWPLHIFLEGSSLYELSKRDPPSESVRLSDLDSTSLKKITADCSSVLDSGLYPTPYLMTKLETSDKEDIRTKSNHFHTSPLKSVFAFLLINST